MSDGTVSGVGFPATSEGESKTGKYTERASGKTSFDYFAPLTEKLPENSTNYAQNFTIYAQIYIIVHSGSNGSNGAKMDSLKGW